MLCAGETFRVIGKVRTYLELLILTFMCANKQVWSTYISILGQNGNHKIDFCSQKYKLISSRNVQYNWHVGHTLQFSLFTKMAFFCLSFNLEKFQLFSWCLLSVYYKLYVTTKQTAKRKCQKWSIHNQFMKYAFLRLLFNFKLKYISC